MLMPDMTAISGMITSLKGAVDIAQTMKGLSDATAIQGQIFELNTKILEAQRSAFAATDERSMLINSIRQLEEEVARLKEWDREKEAYELKQVDPGALAYLPKKDTEVAKQPHWLCSNCFEDRKKSHMLHVGEASASRMGMKYQCSRFKASFSTRGGVYPGNEGMES